MYLSRNYCNLVSGDVIIKQCTISEGHLFCTINKWTYYIKVNCTPGGNKLLKTIRYLHMWRYDILAYMWKYRWFYWYYSLMYHRNISGSYSKAFGHLRKLSEILGKCSGTFVWWPSKQFWKILGNLQRSTESGRKIIKNAVISMFIYIKKEKKNITCLLEDMNFMFSWQEQYLATRT